MLYKREIRIILQPLINKIEMKEKKEFKKQKYVPPYCFYRQMLEESFICTSVSHEASSTTEEAWEEEYIRNQRDPDSDNWIEF